MGDRPMSRWLAIGQGSVGTQAGSTPGPGPAGNPRGLTVTLSGVSLSVPAARRVTRIH